ncbi:hypothetical protein ACOBR4_03305 [Gardnerella piotii]
MTTIAYSQNDAKQEARQGGEPLLMHGSFTCVRALVGYSPHHRTYILSGS